MGIGTPDEDMQDNHFSHLEGAKSNKFAISTTREDRYHSKLSSTWLLKFCGMFVGPLIWLGWLGLNDYCISKDAAGGGLGRL